MSPKQTKWLLQIICSLFIFLFTYTALSKFLEFSTFKSVLSRSPLIGSFNHAVAWTIPSVELATAGLLLFHSTRFLALYVSMVLMLIFTCYTGYMAFFVSHLPCACGGVISKMTWSEHFVFNIVFTVLAFLGLDLYQRASFLKEEPVLR